MLELILIKYFGLKTYWNYEEEKQATNWHNCYIKLIHLIYDLEELGVLESNKIIEKLDKINDTEE